MATSVPEDTRAENPTRGPMFTIASITEPLWEHHGHPARQEVLGDRPDVQPAARPGAMTPMQLGPAIAMPNSRPTRAIAAWATRAASPVSENPPPGTIAARTPRAPAERSTSGTRSMRTAAATASGVSGTSSSEGKHGRPRTSSYRGFTG